MASRHYWEDQDATALWNWASHHPLLRNYLYHIPNGGKRGRIEAARMKGMGVRAGVSDYHLPLCRRGYYSLWVELKATPPNDAPVSKTQMDWLKKMSFEGHACFVCKGWEAAVVVYKWYVGKRILHAESQLDDWIESGRIQHIDIAVS